MLDIVNLEWFIVRSLVECMEPNVNQIVSLTYFELLNLWRWSTWACLNVISIFSFCHVFNIIVLMMRAVLSIKVRGIHACSRFTIESPSMERTFNATVPLDFSTESKIRSHMRAVSMHSIWQVIFSSENCNVSSIDLLKLRLSSFEFIWCADSEPAIWVWWRRVSTLCISSSNIPAKFLFWPVEFIFIQVKYLVE